MGCPLTCEDVENRIGDEWQTLRPLVDQMLRHVEDEAAQLAARQAIVARTSEAAALGEIEPENRGDACLRAVVDAARAVRHAWRSTIPANTYQREARDELDRALDELDASSLGADDHYDPQGEPGTNLLVEDAR